MAKKIGLFDNVGTGEQKYVYYRKNTLDWAKIYTATSKFWTVTYNQKPNYEYRFLFNGNKFRKSLTVETCTGGTTSSTGLSYKPLVCSTKTYWYDEPITYECVLNMNLVTPISSENRNSKEMYPIYWYLYGKSNPFMESEETWLQELCAKIAKKEEPWRIPVPADYNQLAYVIKDNRHITYFVKNYWNPKDTFLIILKHIYPSSTSVSVSSPVRAEVDRGPLFITAATSQKIEDEKIITQQTKIEDPKLLQALPVPDVDINFKDFRYAKAFFGRTFVWGSEQKPNVFMTSDLENVEYFPEYNVYKISKNESEKIQNMVYFSNVVVVFTNLGIYMVRNIENIGFQIKQINSGLGTLFSKSIQVIGNYIYFIGTDNRVYILKNLYNISDETKTNVELIDLKINNNLTKLLVKANRKRVFTVSHNLEYQIFIEDKRFRFYTEKHRKIWTFDRSDFFKDVYGAYSENGVLILYHKDGIFSDEDAEYLLDNSFEVDMEILTPKYDFGYPHHKKSYRKMLLQFGDTKLYTPVELFINVNVDGAVIKTYTVQEGVVDKTNTFILQETDKPNVTFEDFSGVTDYLIKTLDTHFKSGEELEANQKIFRVSSKGYTFQFLFKYKQNKPVNLKSLGVDVRIKKAK